LFTKKPVTPLAKPDTALSFSVPSYHYKYCTIPPPKKRKFRMIQYSSYPKGRSVNDFIPEILLSLQYALVIKT
jgi:hypothetical protein